MTIRFRSEALLARFRSPDGTQDVERRLQVRWDPLLGTSSRISEGVALQRTQSGALDAIREPSPTCPFCPQNLERVTPQLPSSISSEPRIHVGETLLFPNLVPYAQYAAVAVFSPRHWLSLADFTPKLLASNVTAAIRYIRTVQRTDPHSAHCAYNINYLYPSGGSLPHPHAQVYVDPYPTTLLRLQYEAGDRYHERHHRSYWDDLAKAEEESGERFVGSIGATSWMTPFAPLGFNEVRAVVVGRQTLPDLSDDEIQALSLGVSRVLSWYDELGYDSFNLALYSGPLGGSPAYRVNLAMVTRTALLPYYRSDAMYLERLHWEAAVDRAPEALAESARTHFQE